MGALNTPIYIHCSTTRYRVGPLATSAYSYQHVCADVASRTALFVAVRCGLKTMVDIPHLDIAIPEKAVGVRAIQRVC